MAETQVGTEFKKLFPELQWDCPEGSELPPLEAVIVTERFAHQMREGMMGELKAFTEVSLQI